jgi:hypothetical protein
MQWYVECEYLVDPIELSIGWVDCRESSGETEGIGSRRPKLGSITSDMHLYLVTIV